jgi:hypothetical protein
MVLECSKVNVLEPEPFGTERWVLSLHLKVPQINTAYKSGIAYCFTDRKSKIRKLRKH